MESSDGIRLRYDFHIGLKRPQTIVDLARTCPFRSSSRQTITDANRSKFGSICVCVCVCVKVWEICSGPPGKFAHISFRDVPVSSRIGFSLLVLFRLGMFCHGSDFVFVLSRFLSDRFYVLSQFVSSRLVLVIFVSVCLGFFVPSMHAWKIPSMHAWNAGLEYS